MAIDWLTGYTVTGSTRLYVWCMKTLHPNIRMHIFHTILYAFPKTLTICFSIRGVEGRVEGYISSESERK